MAWQLTGVPRAQLAAELAALQDVCSCRLSAQCRQLMNQLALQGTLPKDVLTMTDAEWVAACQASRTGQVPPIQ